MSALFCSSRTSWVVLFQLGDKSREKLYFVAMILFPETLYSVFSLPRSQKTKVLTEGDIEKGLALGKDENVFTFGGAKQ